jgi:hypothetical protein
MAGTLVAAKAALPSTAPKASACSAELNVTLAQQFRALPGCHLVRGLKEAPAVVE